MKLRSVLIFIVILCSLRCDALGEDAQSNGDFYIYYYLFDEQSDEYWAYREIYLNESDDADENIYRLFKYFFNGAELGFIPQDVELYNIRISDGCLTLNVSRHILNYGGNFYERCLVNQIVKTSLAIPGIESVTLLVENNNIALTEGIKIENLSEEIY